MKHASFLHHGKLSYSFLSTNQLPTFDPLHFSILWNFSMSSLNVTVLPMSLPLWHFHPFHYNNFPISHLVLFCCCCCLIVFYTFICWTIPPFSLSIFVKCHMVLSLGGKYATQLACFAVYIRCIVTNHWQTVRSDVIGYLSWCSFVIYILIMWTEQLAAKSVFYVIIQLIYCGNWHLNHIFGQWC